MIIGPQPGPQTAFLSSRADIVFYGGSAGGGKTVAILLEVCRHLDKPGFGAVIFRRTCPEITNEGGLWDTSEKFLPHAGMKPRQGDMEWTNGKATIKFAHMQHEKNKHAWQGAAIPLICFDELTHFSEGMFFYMLSRNRLTHDIKVKPYIRATTNPDPDSWVAKFIDWWLDEAGFPIPERSGVIRYFIRDGNDVIWADRAEDLACKPGQVPKSFTFISSKLSDNKILMEQDPGYLSNLHALPLIDRVRLLDGNWKMRATQGMLFRKEWFAVVDAHPPLDSVIRFWDRAATEQTPGTPDPDWTVGVKVGRAGGIYYVLDVVRIRGTPKKVRDTILNTATQDGQDVTVALEEEGGSSGKADVFDLVTMLAGFAVIKSRPQGSKATRAKPASAQAETGNIKIMRGAWNNVFLDELDGFVDEDQVKPPKGYHDDQVDGFTGSMNLLMRVGPPSARAL